MQAVNLFSHKSKSPFSNILDFNKTFRKSFTKYIINFFEKKLNRKRDDYMRNRTIKKSFYLNEEENRLLKEKCFGGFISESDFFRMCILNKEIKEKPDEKFYDTLEQLRGIATNINQIARVANQTRAIDIDSLKEFEKEVKDIIADLRKKYL